MEDSETTIGWREWVRLPGLGGAEVKAKIDTGARTSCLHAYDLLEVERDGRNWVEFAFHPLQRDESTIVETAAPLVDRRRVTASNGVAEVRPVVATMLLLGGRAFEIELTLTRRDEMGFRMLIGRRALQRRFLVDPRRSYRGHESKERQSRSRLARVAG